MANATLNGVTIAYDDIAPAGAPQRTILLLHGFASNRNEGWRRTGWYGAFERRGFRTIALDQRGHAKLAADAVALLDHLGVGRCEVLGYSMGTRTALQMAIDTPDRIGHLMLGGVGSKLFDPPRPGYEEAMAQAMAAEDPAGIDNAFLKSFRQFADEQGEDRQALAQVFPAGRGVRLPGCDHFSAIPHASLKATVFDFLDGLLDDDFPPFE